MLTPNCTCNTRVTTQQVAQPLQLSRSSPLTTHIAAASRGSSALPSHRGQQCRKVNLSLTSSAKP